jgi:hypothetical protein
MGKMENQPAAENQLDRLRALTDRLDCLTETDFMLLCKATAGTVEAWRKRGQGPEYIRAGNRVLYPRQAVAKFLESCIRERSRPTCTLM